jgi:hypothetical protein
MSWRSVIALLLLAFVGGGAAFAWISSDGSMPWETQKARIAEALEEVEAAAASSPVALPAPTIIQPSASQAEAALLALNARRMMEAGKPLGDLASRLQVTFGQSQPQALATINAAARQPLSNAMLLRSFDAIAPKLQQPVGTAWDRGRYELGTLFVIHRGEAKPTAMAARIERARDAIIAGDVEFAAKTVRAMPGASHANAWLAEANRAIAVRRAFDALSQSAMTPPPPPPPVASPPPSADPPVTTTPSAPASNG